MNEPLVSVIITNFNYEKYISEAIQSIAEQKYQTLEVIVVDDGSTDHSRKVIEKLKEKYEERFQRFSTHFLPTNRGINGALNVAAKDIRGEIAMVFDADDILERNHLKKTVSALLKANKKDPSVTFAYCDCLLIDEVGKKIQRGLSKPFDSNLIKTESFLPRPSPILSSVLRTSFPLPENHSKDPKHMLWKKICRKGNQGVYVSEPLFRYRIHSKNASNIGKKKRAAQKTDLLEQPVHLSDYWPHS